MKVLMKPPNAYMREVDEKFVKAFLDVVIGLVLVKSRPASGYRIIERIYKVFNVFIAPSVLYPTLHSMVKKKLVVKHKTTRRGGIFMLTASGEVWLKEMVKALSNIRFSMMLLTGGCEEYLSSTSLLPLLVSEDLEPPDDHPLLITLRARRTLP